MVGGAAPNESSDWGLRKKPPEPSARPSNHARVRDNIAGSTGNTFDMS